MTQKGFDELPLLLKASQVKRVLGLSDEGLRALRAMRRDVVLRQFNGRWHYCKRVVAELARLEYR